MNTSFKEPILNIPLFSGIESDNLLLELRDCEIKEFKPGQCIYRYGEFGEDCCIILSGSVKVELPHKRTPHTSNTITLKYGEIIGEIAALSGYARTADVVALETTKVIIISRETLLQLLDRFPLFKEKIYGLYRQRALSSLIPTVPIFAGVPANLLEELINKATLFRYNKGDVIFGQGDDADTFYIVRYGFVKISETKKDGKERVLAYLKGGHYFGEMALMKKNEKRMATTTAINRTELIGISREDFITMVESNPRVKSSLEKAIKKTKEKISKIRKDECMERTLSAVIDSGAIQARGILVIDNTRCIQCDSCTKACAVLHNNKSRLVRKGRKLTNTLLIPTSCWNCSDPTCMIECPTGSIIRDSTGEIYHRDNCIGCGYCVRNCPYGNISIVTFQEACEKKDFFQKHFARHFRKKQGSKVEKVAKQSTNGKTVERKRSLKKAVKCDMCREYPFLGCVYNCPTGAARNIEPAEFFTDIMVN